MKPLIGLTPTPQVEVMEHGTFRRHALSDHYSKAVEAAGGIPVMLPAHYAAVAEMLDRIDGLIITGGGDIDPAQFGQDPHEKTGDIDAERDAFEQAMFHEAIQRDMPVLGICRGLQIFNVALGGTLYQDVADLVADSQEHRQQSLGVHAEESFQTAVLTDGENPLRTMVNGDAFEINSFHHQNIDRLADSLQAIAHTEDGVVEAVYNPDMTYGMAVQFHPEMLAHKRAEHAAIFTSLVNAASAYQKQGNEVPELV